MKLQEDVVTLKDVRYLFDALVNSYPEMTTYLSEDAPIIENPSFEKSIVLCLEGQFDNISDLQKADLDRLQKTPEVEVVESSSFADQILSSKKAKIEIYGNLKCVPPTSNKCERLFSTAKLIAAPQRNQMTPLHLEENCFLLLNRNYWNVETVQDTI